jgi:GT2 family glycosyltransferase
MISVITPNFNGSRYLPALFSSLKKNSLITFELIFVDNGSTDNSLSIVKKYFPQAVIIKNSSNRGFAAAVNQGIRASRQPYVCLLNNDLVLDKNWFKYLSAAIKEHPDVACFCGTVLNHDGSAVESQGIDFNWSGKCLQIKNQPAGIIWGSSAAAVIYKKDIIEKIGLFDEKYFAYLEDVDMAFRLHQKNYHTLLVPRAVVYHLGGGTADKMGNFRAKQTFKNWYYFILKNYTFPQIFTNFPEIVFERLRNLSFLLKSTIK